MEQKCGNQQAASWQLAFLSSKCQQILELLIQYMLIFSREKAEKIC